MVATTGSTGGPSAATSMGDVSVEPGVEALASASPPPVRAMPLFPVRSYSSSDDEVYHGDVNGDGVKDDDVYFDTVEYSA